MKGNIEERACDLAVYIIENRTTVRAAAKKFGVSKSTVHKDIQDRLPQINHSTAEKAGQPALLPSERGAGRQQTGAAHPRRHRHEKKI